MSNSNDKDRDVNFCPLCQAPLLFLKISPLAHVAGCSVVWDVLPACPDGKNCLSSSIFHFRDYSHCELAAYRSSNEYVNPSVEDSAGNSAKKSPIKSDKKIKIKLKHKGKKNENSNKGRLDLKNRIDDSFCNEDSDDQCTVFKEDRTNKKKNTKRPSVSFSDKNVRITAKKFKRLDCDNNSSISSDVDKTETKDVLLNDLDIDLVDCTGNNVNRDCDISSSSIDIFNDEIKCNNGEDKIFFSQYFHKSINSNYEERIDFVNEQCFTSSPKQDNSVSTPSSSSVSYSPLESDKSSPLSSERIGISTDRPEDNNIVKQIENRELSPVKTFSTFKFVPKTEHKYKLSTVESSENNNSLHSTKNASSCVLNSQKNEKTERLHHESADTHCIETNISEFYKNDSTVFNTNDELPTPRVSSNDNANNTSVNKKINYLTKFQMGINEKKVETGKVEGLSLHTTRGVAPKIFEKKDNIEVSDGVTINGVDRPSIKYFGQRSTVKKVCPFFKRIPDTSVVVDAFQYGYIPGISNYFLTHFHSDHYVGLKKSFSMPIFCSEITANLVKMMIGVNETWLNVINVGERRIVNGTEVVALEANHCPGSLMFLFQLRTGQNYLHVGDFRFCTEMETYPELQKLHINKLFLDTTYCKPNYDFPAQVDIVDKVVNIAKDEVMKNPKLLIVCGSYVIGKEKVFRAIAKECNFNIWAESNKKRVFKCLNYPDILSRIKNNPSEAQLHVISMQNITFEKLGQHLDKHNTYKNIVAFRPTGWASKHSNVSGSIHRRVQDRIVIYDVPYSEHSSFSELRRFVQYIKPDEIIPTVNVGSPALREEMQRYFTSWLSELKQPRQSNLLDFLKLSKK